METLQLVGYTADLRYLVFSDASRGGAQLRVPVDDDLIATFDEIVDLLRPPRQPPVEPPATAPQPTIEQPVAPPVADPGPPPVADPEPSPVADPGPAVAVAPDPRPRPGQGVLAGLAIIAATPATELPSDIVRPRQSELSPREIQSRLRAGASAKAIARDAGTTEAWVERWMPPIEAEREQVEAAVRASVISRRRLGESTAPVGEAVRANLEARGLDPTDPEEVRWQTVRREGDSYWSVSVRFRQRGKLQRALYRWDVEEAVLDPRNDLARELGFTRPGGRGAGGGRKAKAEAPSSGEAASVVPGAEPVAEPVDPGPAPTPASATPPPPVGDAEPEDGEAVRTVIRPSSRRRDTDAPPLVVLSGSTEGVGDELDAAAATDAVPDPASHSDSDPESGAAPGPGSGSASAS